MASGVCSANINQMPGYSVTGRQMQVKLRVAARQTEFCVSGFLLRSETGKIWSKVKRLMKRKKAKNLLFLFCFLLNQEKFMRKAKNVNYISFHSEMEQYETKYKVSEAKTSDKNVIFISLLIEAKSWCEKSAKKLFFLLLSGSRQRERRGFGKVSNILNMSRTAVIEVLFSFNFDVVFDFMYFRFRPSKAKWIGNVLTNRRNAAIRSMFFFPFILHIAYWRTKSVCVIR